MLYLEAIFKSCFISTKRFLNSNSQKGLNYLSYAYVLCFKWLCQGAHWVHALVSLECGMCVAEGALFHLHFAQAGRTSAYLFAVCFPLIRKEKYEGESERVQDRHLSYFRILLEPVQILAVCTYFLKAWASYIVPLLTFCIQKRIPRAQVLKQFFLTFTEANPSEFFF